jgi:hypothetical protein
LHARCPELITSGEKKEVCRQRAFNSSPPS